ncbi:MAG: porin family protein [Bacteroidales bacterium]|nr:porin family protein [Bacteroidales bacterium]
MRSLRHILATAAILAGAFSASAQNHYEANVAIGAKGGYTLSKISFNPTVPQGMLGGFTAGAAFRYAEEKNFGLIAEFNIEQRGWKEKFEGTSFQYSKQLTYIQIPILTHIYFSTKHFKGFFNAGPEIGYMIASSTKANFDYNHIEDIPDFPKHNRYNDQLTLPIKNRFDYGISAGVGMEWIKDHKHSFNLEGRFYYGLGNVFSSKKTDPFSGSNSMSIMLTLGYYYRLK